MRLKTSAFLVGLAVAVLIDAAAQARVQTFDRTVLALDRILSPAIQPLYVSSVAAQPGQPIPDLYTAFGKNISPPIEWDGVPPGVESFAVIMEDSDSPTGYPVLHWLAYNIPAASKGLARNIRGRTEAKAPLGMEQGVNFAGGIGYIGPHPPLGDPPHHYHFEVFALNKMLRIHGGLSLDKVITAMNEHILAEGEVVGTFASPGPDPNPDPVAKEAPVKDAKDKKPGSD